MKTVTLTSNEVIFASFLFNEEHQPDSLGLRNCYATIITSEGKPRFFINARK